jgi:hypothetical protein
MLMGKNLRIIAFVLIFAFLLVSCSTNSGDAQTEIIVTSAVPGDTVSLDWKLAEGEILAYRTTMNQIDAASAAITIDWESIFEGVPFNDASTPSANLLGNLSLPQVSSLISILEPNARGNINVRMVVGEMTPAENQSENAMNQTFSEMMQEMEGTVQLRGELTSDGAIASFYLEQRQRNLLAMFFELPTQPVQVGDTWEIDVNCVSMGSGFVADKASRINQVELTELSTTTDGKPLAVIDYMIAEAVDGAFHSPLSEEPLASSMSCSFVGRGYFLIEEGRWQQFLGEFAIESTGIMASSVIQQFALFPLDVVPQEYLDAE